MSTIGQLCFVVIEKVVFLDHLRGSAIVKEISIRLTVEELSDWKLRQQQEVDSRGDSGRIATERQL